MKRFLMSLTVFLCLTVRPSFADIPEITAIDFYPNGAKFTFTLQTEGDTFNAEIPGAFQIDSVKMIDPDIFDDVKIFRQSREEWIPESLQEIHEQLEAKRQTIREIQTRKSAIEHTLELLNKAQPPTRTDAKDIIAYIQMSESMKESSENEIAELNQKMKEESDKAELLMKEYEKRKPVNSESLICISGHIKAGKEIKFEAFTSNAKWKPEYIMDLNSHEGKITTRIQTRASQHTGLDYTGDVTFHTKRPNESVSTPELNPLKVSIKPKERYREEVMYDYAAPMEMSERNYMRASGSRRTQEPSMQATLSDHIIAGKGTLTGDNIEALFMHGELELNGKIIFELIPEQRSDVWILVSMNEGNIALIPGEAELRIDGMPAGKTSIPEYGLGQKKIAFGYAPQITSKKEAMISTTGSSWFSGTNSSGYTLKITNGTKEHRRVTVRDRLPIPTNEKIKLEVKSIEPEPKERDRENKLMWEIELEAGETKTILVDYTLSYPSGEELQFSR